MGCQVGLKGGERQRAAQGGGRAAPTHQLLRLPHRRFQLPHAAALLVCGREGGWEGQGRTCRVIGSPSRVVPADCVPSAAIFCAIAVLAVQ